MHIVLNLVEVPHPHTGENLADCLLACMRDWKIPSKKVLLIITDNGANIVKAVRIMNDKAEQCDQSLQAEANGSDHEQDNDQVEAGDSSDSDTDEDDAQDDSEAEKGEEMGDDTNSDDFDDNLDEVIQQTEDFNATETDVFYTRMKCMAHTLQLVIKKAYKHYDSLITKARRLVSHVRSR